MSVAAPQSPAEPINHDTLAALRALASGRERDELMWMSGYLAALAHNGQAPASSAVAAGREAPEWTVFFASETGNSRKVAEALAARAGEYGVDATAQDLGEFRAHRLAKVKRGFFVVATHGLGDAPEGTRTFFDHLLSDDAERLEDLEYGVLALGDSSYADFCEVGRVLDARLEALGATRIVERVDCDLNFRPAAEKWTLAALEQAKARAPLRGASITRLHAVEAGPSALETGSFECRVVTNQRITGRGSSKDVRHIEIDLDGSGLAYLPGDSLGVMPENPPQLIEQLLDTFSIPESTHVTIDGESMPITAALRSRKEITTASGPLLQALGEVHPELEAMRADRERLRELLLTHQVIDLVANYPAPWDAQALVDNLRDLPPRLYSIASSPDANPDEAHLTVAVVNYQKFGREHWGAASNFMAAGAKRLQVHIEGNDNFRLPDDGDSPIIMIGAGTGIAPYRAFVEHRREHAHAGDNWLIFGDRNFFTDFLYQSEWLKFRGEGYLRRLDLAFSRDGAEKIYVQHRIAERAREFYDWLERGAHLYVCGDANAFAHDAHEAILGVLRSAGDFSHDQAIARLDELRLEGRYQRDVY